MKRRIEIYRPSNGTEGMAFMDKFCCHCFHERAMTNPKGEGKACSIVAKTMAFDENDKEYPREWRYIDGKPTCTRHVPYDWNDDDREPPNGPRRPRIPDGDPMQFMLFSIADEIENTERITAPQYVEA